MSIVGILAGLAIPNLRTMIYRARATEVAGDLEVVRVAAISYNATQNAWPAEAALGVIPGVLTDFLPVGFSFQDAGYQIDFENWSLPGGLPGDPNTRTLIGVSVTTDEDALGNAVAEFLGGSIVFSVGNTHTVVIDRSQRSGAGNKADLEPGGTGRASSQLPNWDCAECHRLIQSNMFYEQSTDGIRVRVLPRFSLADSDTADGTFVFSYQIEMENEGDRAAQLLFRHWLIHDAAGDDTEVDGEGVIGEQPLLNPGESHEYRSYCVLRSPVGYMEGYYTFARPDGKRFRVEVPRFNLNGPFVLPTIPLDGGEEEPRVMH